MTDYAARFRNRLNVAAKQNGDQPLDEITFQKIKADFIASASRLMGDEKIAILLSQIEKVAAEDAVVRQCKICRTERSIDQFYARKGRTEMMPYCKICNAEKWQKDKNGGKHFFAHSYSSAKKRAAAKGLAFDIDTDYLNSIFPKDRRCPIFGIIMEAGVRGNFDASPSLDKIIPERGYVRGNLWYISMKANRIKSDHSISDILITACAVYKKLQEVGIESQLDGGLVEELKNVLQEKK